MTLAEIETPFERKRVIEYSKRDPNKVVRHWIDVQPLIGSLWKTRNEPGEYGGQEFSVYLFHDEKLDGLRVANRMLHPEFYTPEKMLDMVKNYGIDTYDHLIATYDGYMSEDVHIDLATIEYVRQFDQEKARIYSEYRQNRFQRKELERQEKHRIQMEQKDREKRLQEEQLAADKAKYLGWVDTMTAMHYGRVSNLLEKLVRVDGKVMTKRDFIISAVNDGLVPQKEENVVTEWRGRESKPKTEYHLKDVIRRSFYTISKTEYDFALFLHERRTAD